MQPRQRAVSDFVLSDGTAAAASAVFGQTSTQAIAATVATVQHHAHSLSAAHISNAVSLVSCLSAKGNACPECFPESCACAQNGLTTLLNRLAALEGAALSISQRSQREALEKLLCQAIASAAADPPLARATIGALQRAAAGGGAHDDDDASDSSGGGAAGAETLVPRLLCAGVPSEVGLLRAAAPLLSAVQARLSRCDDVEVRTRGLALLGQLWQQSAARWPALPHGRQLAEALARAAGPSALLDPSAKVRLGATRLLLLLAPQLTESDALVRGCTPRAASPTPCRSR